MSRLVPQIVLTYKDLEKFFSIDHKGNRLTLGRYIEEISSNRQATLREERLGPGTARKLASVEHLEAGPNFSSEDIDLLVEQYLDSMGDNVVLEITGDGSFDAEQLREEIFRGTRVGRQIVEMILSDRDFIEREIKRGNYKITD